MPKTSLFISAAFAATLAIAGGAAADPLASPSMSGPPAANPSPTSFDAGPFGQVYIGGVATGLGLAQNNPAPGDDDARGDVSNAQLFIQTTEGPVQFFVQAGTYSIPSLGLPYADASTVTEGTFGAVPVAYVKLVPNEQISILAGKLPTLVGAEYTFTFQNMNIARGLLWNQEPAVSRGVQVNYASGPVSASVSWNDGYYSDRANWVSAAVSYTASPSDVISVIGATSLSTNTRASFATPPLQNNSSIFNVIWTHTSGGLTIVPYLQYSQVEADEELGITDEGSTLGAAVLAKYAVTPEFSLAARAEYISSSGDAASGAPNLLYGAGSKAFSATVTPTWQKGVLFVRGELSYVRLSDFESGLGFGGAGEDRNQVRAMAEAGILF
ncbi:outer membrane beta-barrel protein [Phenylobacterium deserti]|uniref:Porin n=1 Tax=Phenylobacterium deserti TaxID=1914756 RepID=A0A328AUC5_9CAUL|nr:outer membrane beta-barrel protein [Phenylobacterium deserti]RAK57761.1 porin [Phenylobacterium deserti]